MNPLLILWPSAQTDELSIKIDHLMEKHRADKLFKSVRCSDTDGETLSLKISEAFTTMITLTMSDTTLHIITVIPTDEPDMEQKLDMITKALSNCNHPTTLHIVGLRSSVTGHKAPEDEAHSIERYRTSGNEGKQFSYSLIDNYVSSGAPLDLDFNATAEYLGLLFNALIHDYYAIFPPAIVNALPGMTTAIGVSSLRFDRDVAIEYLVRRAFLAALDREGINNREVDAQKAANAARKIINGIENRFPKFLKKHILEPYRDKDISEGEIVAQTEAPLRKEIEDIETHLTSFLTDPSLSFPEKECILAIMLGRDNEALRGVQYDGDTTIVDDACKEPLELYVNAFNEYGNESSDLPVRGNFERLKKYQFNFETLQIEEDPDNNKAFYPLDTLKNLKQQILNLTAFIRSKEEELSVLDQSERERREIERAELKRQTGTTDPDNNNPIQRRATLPEICEQPLNDIYRPAENLKPRQSVDLRPYFSAVRDQGAIGSCSSFAAVSMYEAMYNRYTASNKQIDLSERFVYYFSNVVKGNPEGGSNYFEQLSVMGQQGVCREELFGYSTSNLDSKPPSEALDDAIKHRVLKGRQIPLQIKGDRMEAIKHNHKILTSALSEGYPVGISLNIYKSFGKNGPYINRPDESELSDGNVEHHAMVLVGYSEEKHCYIVRNSWGPDFGDNGYCYISCAYIDDPTLNTFACVITETTDTIGTPAEVKPLIAPFAGTETQIKIASIRNILDQCHVELQSLQENYNENYRYYQALIQALGIPAVRTRIREAAEAKALERYDQLSDEHRRLDNEFLDKMSSFRKNYIIGACIFSFSTIIMLALAWIFGDSLWAWITAGGMTILPIGLWLNYTWQVRKYRRQLAEQLEDLNARKAAARRSFMETQLCFHSAGMWIDRIHTMTLELQRTYDRLISFNNNLRGWYTDDTLHAEGLPQRSGRMFRYYDHIDMLDKTFDENRNEIVDQIDLMSTFANYRIDKENIHDARHRLRHNVREAINPIFASFNMGQYLCGRHYPYLPSVDIEHEISTLISIGLPSTRNNAIDPEPPTQIMMANHDHSFVQKWKTSVYPFFTFPPHSIDTDNPTTIDLVTIQAIPAETVR